MSASVANNVLSLSITKPYVSSEMYWHFAVKVRERLSVFIQAGLNAFYYGLLEKFQHLQENGLAESGFIFKNK